MEDAGGTTFSDDNRSARLAFWGLLPALLVTITIKLFYLLVSGVLALGALVLIDAMRTTFFALTTLFALIMLSASFVRSRRHLLLHLASWQLVVAAAAVAEVVGVYFAIETGATFDLYVMQAGMASNLASIVSASTPTKLQMLILANLAAALLFPWYTMWREPPSGPPISLRAWGVIAVVSACLASLPPLTDSADRYAAIAPSTIVTMTGQLPRFLTERAYSQAAERPREQLAAVHRSQGHGQRNVVIIVLESTRWDATTLARPELQTTPHMATLGQQAWVFERAYTTVPGTSKALVAALCGIYPNPSVRLTEAGRPVPRQCLPELLADVGYESMFLHPSPAGDQLFGQVAQNLGFERRVHLEDMDLEGFRRANWVGYEESTMLQPSEQWVREKLATHTPFLLTYVTTSAHHNYDVPVEKLGAFDDNELYNRYLSGVRVTDDFVGDVIEMLQRNKAWPNTVLVLFGDHGEAFGEHGLTKHNGVMYDEGLRVPLVIRVPDASPRRVDGVASQIDLLPTIITTSGHELQGEPYDGIDLSSPPLPSRTLYASCVYDHRCVALIDWPQKYIFNFGRRADELYDLAADPAEERNLAPDRPAAADQFREQLLLWYRDTRRRHLMHISD